MSCRTASPLTSILRHVSTFVGMATRPLRVKDLGASMIINTVSLSWHIGRAVALARKQRALDIGRILVERVRGDAIFGDLVHAHGADLQFDTLARRSNDGGVQ